MTPAPVAGSDTAPMILGPQKNPTRPARRPDGRFTREIRRRGGGRATLLDLAHGHPPPRSPLARLAALARRLLGR